MCSDRVRAVSRATALPTRFYFLSPRVGIRAQNRNVLVELKDTFIPQSIRLDFDESLSDHKRRLSEGVGDDQCCFNQNIAIFVDLPINLVKQ